jgi:hypothetical protein
MGAEHGRQAGLLPVPLEPSGERGVVREDLGKRCGAGHACARRRIAVVVMAGACCNAPVARSW